MYQWWPYIYEIINRKADLYMSSVEKELQAIADKQLEKSFYRKPKKKSIVNKIKLFVIKLKRNKKAK